MRLTATLSKSPTPLIEIPAGSFVMGSDQHYPEEAPARQVNVSAFCIDAHTVTNADFAAFVQDSGYVTSCEHLFDATDQPYLPKEARQPGGLVFQMTPHPVRLTDPHQWWAFIPGACWRHPEGPGSSIAGRENHPVVHASFDDALAYATWAGKSLPTEAQWEYAAARSSQPEAKSGPELNIWRGAFPYRHDRVSAHPFTVPAESAQPSFGNLSNMLGNVWEWTIDPYEPTAAKDGSCCTATDTCAASAHTVRVLKGGSYLCADSYCQRYRPSARISMPQNESAGHIGFRCVVNLAQT